MEKRLSQKTYNETLLVDRKYNNPVEALGEMFIEENKKEIADLSYIRFAQGEIYYSYQDYETAIFKWENIANELEPWAKKNVGDAYFELGLYSTAVDFYKSIQADSLVLQTEIALKLFEVYLAEGKQDLAVSSIKKAVEINPDYQTITEVARAFFEQSNDWDNAVELAVNESIRTEQDYWFDMLNQYIEEGHTKEIDPDYFSAVLEVIYSKDGNCFERIVVSLWNSYKDSDRFILWIQTINRLLGHINVEESNSWNVLSRLFQEAFVHMVGGAYELTSIIHIMPRLLTNWARIAQPAQTLSAYAAVIAWNEFYQGALDQETVQAVEQKIWHCKDHRSLLSESLELFRAIERWASSYNMELGIKMNWFVQEILDLQKQNVIVVGVNGTGKSAFINSILGESLFEAPTKNIIRMKYAEESHVTLISNEDTHSEMEANEVVHLVNEEGSLPADAIVDLSIPADVLESYGITLIDTPGFRGRRDDSQILDMLFLADSILFVVDADSPFTEQERDILLRLKERAPYVPVSFVVTKLDTIYNKQEAKGIVEDAFNRITKYEPNADVIAFSSKYEIAGQEASLKELFAGFQVEADQEKKRTIKLLQVIRHSISMLYKKRVEKEQAYTNSIEWNEEMLTKLNGALTQLDDYKKEKTIKIRSEYHAIKEGIKEEMERNIPQILRECADFIKEDSDFRKIHVELNDEMNIRIQHYMDQTLLPSMVDSLNEWIRMSNEELLESKQYMDEMADTFNILYEEEKVVLLGDFKILDDWHRDIRRMTSSVIIEKENILLRHTPSQFLLKSAGKLFGAITQNKNMLYNQYKKFVENEEYAETTTAVVSKFLLQFDIFEKAIERDLGLFFNQPFIELKRRTEESKETIVAMEENLRIMRENPEIFNDVMTLFKVRLTQYEWMTNVHIGIKESILK
ncbi:MAG: dynamin family protein [Bacillus sp. (in: firmicutes)]